MKRDCWNTRGIQYEVECRWEIHPEDSRKCKVIANVSAAASRKQNMVYNIPEQNGYLWNVVDKCLYITVRNGTWLINWPWESVWIGIWLVSSASLAFEFPRSWRSFKTDALKKVSVFNLNFQKVGKSDYLEYLYPEDASSKILPLSLKSSLGVA
jgi:hypothetical protein